MVEPVTIAKIYLHLDSFENLKSSLNNTFENGHKINQGPCIHNELCEGYYGVMSSPNI